MRLNKLLIKRLSLKTNHQAKIAENLCSLAQPSIRRTSATCMTSQKYVLSSLFMWASWVLRYFLLVTCMKVAYYYAAIELAKYI